MTNERDIPGDIKKFFVNPTFIKNSLDKSMGVDNLGNTYTYGNFILSNAFSSNNKGISNSFPSFYIYMFKMFQLLYGNQ